MAITSDEERAEFVEHLKQLFMDVDEEAYMRHMDGAVKYGPLKFLGADTLQEAYEELLDLINYARYTAVKVKLLQVAVAERAADVEGSETTGVSQFVPTYELLKGMKR